MEGAHVWRGRAGSVLLGPTEHRVATWLAGRTADGRVTLPTSAIIAACHLERSEGYRITARLRTLGLFGVENDRGGHRGGRRWWRTSRQHDGAELEPVKHRTAWRRLVAWARWRIARAERRLAAIRDYTSRAVRPVPGGAATSRTVGLRTLEATPAPRFPRVAAPAPSEFAERMLEAGIGPLLERWAART